METKAELIHVSWPTKRQAIVFTVVIVLISLFTAMLLGFFDYIFSLVLRQIIQKNNEQARRVNIFFLTPPQFWKVEVSISQNWGGMMIFTFVSLIKNQL